eukprot:COSAG01_NODE_7360_length_3237_cov_1.253346_4_plen_82_part_00
MVQEHPEEAPRPCALQHLRPPENTHRHRRTAMREGRQTSASATCTPLEAWWVGACTAGRTAGSGSQYECGWRSWDRQDVET